ncbi:MULTISPECIES: response regulator [Rheinheimera]|uniref:Response regulator n=1 Tax=Rheinheimera marina TaxID=1774958 RepID=A0ABV9JGZ6_9GAMM
MIRILLAEDQAMVRGALAALLRMNGQFEVVEAADGLVAKQQLQQQAFDLLLSDIEMPGCSGLDLALYVKQQQLPLQVMILTTFGRAGYVQRALDAGVKAFLLKDAPVEQLTKAIQQVLLGKKVIDPELLLNALGEKDPLTEKERQALRLASEGKTTAEIAVALFIAEGTARNYLSEAISKLQAGNRVDAARIARQKGWL